MLDHIEDNAANHALANGLHGDPFALLGPHPTEEGVIIRTLQPGAVIDQHQPGCDEGRHQRGSDRHVLGAAAAEGAGRHAVVGQLGDGERSRAIFQT